MNDWGIPADDDINPLGPTPAGLDTEPAERGEAVEEFTDGTGSVTLGVDDDGVIVAIRIKNNWQDAGRGQPLSALVMSAGLALSGRMPQGDMGVAVVSPSMPQVDSRRLMDQDYFDPEVISRIERGFAELGQSVDPDEEGYRDRTDFTPAEGSSMNRKITVVLGPGKLLQRCTIDPEWSSGARVDKIAETFMEAHGRALASYSPPEVIPGRGRERVKLTQDVAQATLDLLAGRSAREGKDTQ